MGPLPRRDLSAPCCLYTPLWPLTDAPVVNICGFTSETSTIASAGIPRSSACLINTPRSTASYKQYVFFLSADKKLNNQRSSAFALDALNASMAFASSASCSAKFHSQSQTRSPAHLPTRLLGNVSRRTAAQLVHDGPALRVLWRLRDRIVAVGLVASGPTAAPSSSSVVTWSSSAISCRSVTGVDHPTPGGFDPRHRG